MGAVGETGGCWELGGPQEMSPTEELEGATEPGAEEQPGAGGVHSGRECAIGHVGHGGGSSVVTREFRACRHWCGVSCCFFLTKEKDPPRNSITLLLRPIFSLPSLSQL